MGNKMYTEIRHSVSLEVLGTEKINWMQNLEMVVYIKIAVFLDVTPCTLRETYQRF